MLLAIICLALLGFVVYYHMVQGFFTSLISAFCAFIAVLVAFGYFEKLTAMMGGGSMTDYAPGMLLLALYGVTYLVLRILIDSLVPGNLHVQLYVDKVGAVVFGLIAGALGVGTVAVAAQMMPFGASVGGYSPYPLQTRTMLKVTRDAYGDNVRQDQDLPAVDETVDPELKPETASSLLLPVDAFTVAFVRDSSAGPFGGEASFGAIHPSFITELFGLRVGAESSSKRIYINGAGKTAILPQAIFTPSKLPAVDPEMTSLRENQKPLTLTPQGDLLVIRVDFDNTAADADGMVRFTPAAVRLVVDGQVFNPIGNMTNESVIALRRVDDLMIVPLQNPVKGVDLVFQVPTAIVKAVTDAKPDAAEVPPFIELRFMGRTSLAGVPVKNGYAPSPTTLVLQKKSSPAGPAKFPGK